MVHGDSQGIAEYWCRSDPVVGADLGLPCVRVGRDSGGGVLATVAAQAAQQQEGADWLASQEPLAVRLLHELLQLPEGLA